MYGLLVVMTIAAAGEVSLAVEPSTPCVQATGVKDALRNRGLVVVAVAGPTTLVATLAPEGKAVRLRATRAGLHFERVVPLEGDACPAVERIVIALLESWASPAPQPVARPAAGDGGTTPKDRTGLAVATTNPNAREQAALEGATELEQPGGARPPAPFATAPVQRSAGRTTTQHTAKGTPRDTQPPIEDPTVQPHLGAAAASVNGTPGTAQTAAELPADQSRIGPPAANGTPGNAQAPSGFPMATGASRTPPTDNSTPESASDVRASTGNVAPDDPPLPGEHPTAQPHTGAPAASGTGRAATAANGTAGRTQPPAEPPPGPPRIGAPSGAPQPPVVAETSALPLTESTPLRLELAVLGGATLDAAAVATGAGALAVRGAVGRWGLGLDVGLESNRSGTLQQVTAAASSQWLSAHFSVGFEPSARLSFEVALGLRGFRIEAAATGVGTRTDQVAFTWAALASFGASLQLTGPLFLHARAFASLRPETLRFNVEPLGPVLTLNPLMFGLLGGVLVRFD